MKRVSVNYRQNPRKLLSISEFRGVDLYNSPTNVSPVRSPQAPNMIRDVPGKVRKRMGYHTVDHYSDRINGVHHLVAQQRCYQLVHAGQSLYLDHVAIYSGMNDVRSKSWQMEDKLYILDGKVFLCFDGETIEPVSNKAYVPTITLSRLPNGGGVDHEGLNLLSDKWTESFLGAQGAAVYQLSFNELDTDFVAVRVMTAPDVWQNYIQGTHYTFHPTLGTVTFTSAAIPGASPIDGADNVTITVKKKRPEYEARINHCDMGILYGVNGAADRLFLTGNPAFRNYDWYSGMSDLAYFPVNNYCVLGLNTRIVGYSIIGERLAAHKSNDEDGRNVILREGMMVNDRAAFPTVAALQGAGTVSGHTIAYLKTEPLFLSSSGIYAVTPADTNGERYTQNRSFFINSALMIEPEQQEAVAVSYRDFYLLALGQKLYVLDSLLKSYEEGAPYSTHQYEAFVLSDIDARVLWTDGDALRFGTGGGDIMEFYRDDKNPLSYSDNGNPITAFWDTPMFSGDNFYMRKGFKYLALKLAAATVTGVEVFVQMKGIWQSLFREFSKMRYLSFGKLTFSCFTFSCDPTPKAFGKKLTLPKIDKAQFRFYNGNMHEPFGLYNYALEFQQNGKIK
jgi:hypothetical protein